MVPPPRLNAFVLNRAITDTFAKKNYTLFDLERLRLQLEENKSEMNQINAITLMHRCGKHGQDVFHFVDASDIMALLSVEAGVATVQGVVNALYGLKSMNASTPGALEILAVLTEQLKNNRQELFDGQALANALYGLKGFGDSSDERIYHMLDAILVAATRAAATNRPALTTKLNVSANNVVPMTPQGIGIAFLGLQGKSANRREVRELVSYLGTCISRLLVPLDTQAVANILLGMHSFSCAMVEVREVLNALCNHLEKYPTILNTLKAKELSMAFYGLQGMSSSTEEVSRLLCLFNDALDEYPEGSLASLKSNQLVPMLTALGGTMSGHDVQVRRLLRHIEAGMGVGVANKPALEEQAVAKAIYSLHHHTSLTEEVRGILSTLTNSLQQLEQPLSGQFIALSLYGLKKMGSESSEMRALIRALTRKMNRNVTDYTGQHISMACYGLQSMTFNKEVSFLLINLADRIEASDHPMTGQEVATATYGLHVFSAEHFPVRRIIARLADKLCGGSGIILKSIGDGSGNDYYEGGRDASRDELAKAVAALPPLSGQDIAMIMYGLHRMGSEWKEVQLMLGALAARIRFASSSSVMSAVELSRTLWGLQTMGGGSPLPLPEVPLGLKISSSGFPDASETASGSVPNFLFSSPRLHNRYKLPESLVSLLKVLERKLESRRERLSGPMVCSALFGLQGLTTDSGAVRKIIRILSEDLNHSTSALPPRNSNNGKNNNNSSSISTSTNENIYLNGQHIANALFGLQNLTTSKWRLAEDLLVVLARAIDASPLPLSAQGVGNAFYGLQGMSSEREGVRKVLSALTAKVRAMPSSSASSSSSPTEIPLSGQNIGNALWGLRNMTSEHVEVRQALAALADRIKSSPAEMNGQNIGNALYSMHAMDDGKEEVRQVLAALALKLVQSTKPLSGLDLGMSLYGLRSMDSNTPEVRVLLGILVHKIRQTESMQLQHRDLSLAIMSVLKTTEWIEGDEWIRDDLMAVLASKTRP